MQCAIVFSKVLSDPFIFKLYEVLSFDEPCTVNVGAMDF